MIPDRGRFRSRFFVQGFLLLDLQVALVVLSIGLLGLSSLMISSFGQSADALNRTYAVLESKNLLQRIRAHQSGLSEIGAYYSNVSFQQPPQTTTQCINRSCAASVLADFDLGQWQCSLNVIGFGFEDCQVLWRAHYSDEGMFLHLPESRVGLTIARSFNTAPVLQVQVHWQGVNGREQALDFGLSE